MRYLVFLLLAVSAVSGTAWGGEVEINEWPVPWEGTRPRDPYVDGKGQVWFVGQAGDYLARLDPGTGEFLRHELDGGTGPHNLIVDAAGGVWYAGNRAAHIGRLDPGTGRITKVAMPDPEVRDPHTLVFDAHGDIWFTVQHGNVVGKLDVDSSELRVVAVPTPRARPYGIIVASDGRVWFTEFGSHKLGVVDPDTFELAEVPLPREGARPRRLAETSDGAIWYVDYVEGYLGRVDAEASKLREWPVPAREEALPYGLVADDEDRLWFVETGPNPNRLVGFDPESEAFFSVTPIASGGGSVRHMYFDPKRKTIWFGTDTNTIGRALVD